jgi:hypothetical protein
MRRWPLLGIPFLLAGCAMQGTVQRESVEYNTAVAGMANQLTLLNIIRAENGVPTYYTTISRLTGTITVKATAGFNAQIKADSPTVTNAGTNQTATTTGTTITNGTGTTGSLTNTTSPTGPTVANATGTSGSFTNAGATTAASTLTNALTTAITKGGNIYAPSATGEIDSGPQFDINILDTQEFYQGILAGIPFPVIDNYISQEYDNQLLIRLLVLRIDLTLAPMKDSIPNYNHPAGSPVLSLTNASDGAEAEQFSRELSCYQLKGVDKKKDPKILAPLSRLTGGVDNKESRLSLKDLALLDDKTLMLSKPISGTPGEDANVNVVIPASVTRVAELTPLAKCYLPLKISDAANTSPMVQDRTFSSPPPQPVYLGDGKALVLGDDGKSDVIVPVKMDVLFRSTEGVVQFLGRYLYAAKENEKGTYRLGSEPLFSVREGSGDDATVSVELLDKSYSIANDDNRARNMTILGLVEQLVNLHKSAKDRPTTLPVEVLP